MTDEKERALTIFGFGVSIVAVAGLSWTAYSMIRDVIGQLPWLLS